MLSSLFRLCVIFQGCRSVEEFQCLNRIEEGTYGVVYRAKDKKTGTQTHLHSFACTLLTVFIHIRYDFVFSDEIVALKRLKMEKEKEGFPITSLREINTILKAQHPNIVTVRVGWLTIACYWLFLMLKIVINYCFCGIYTHFPLKLGNSCWEQHGQDLHCDELCRT